jgi:hypothetical protein
MMSKSLHLTFYISVLFYFIGCGESFRAGEVQFEQGSQAQVLSENTDPWLSDSNLFPHTQQRSENYMAIFREHQTQLLGMEQWTAELIMSLRALDLSMTSTPGSLMNFQATVHMSCEQRIHFSAALDRGSLQAGQTVHFNSQSQDLSLRLKCVDSVCQEVVLIVSRHRGIPGTVLVAMGANMQEGQAVSYLSRHVDIRPYYSTFHSGPFYRQQNQCGDLQETTTDDRSLRERIVDRVQEEATDFLMDQANRFLRRIFN